MIFSKINNTKSDHQSVIVRLIQPNGVTQDLTTQAQLKLQNPALVKIEGNTIKPVIYGQTQLQVTAAGQTKTISIQVSGAKSARPISFELDVMPVLSRSGCNTGDCHGSARGRDGFHLSLFGYDPDGDYHALTREIPGRRINLALPDRSLMLEKSVGKVPHTGGKLFETDSPLYQTVSLHHVILRFALLHLTWLALTKTCISLLRNSALSVHIYKL